MMLWRAPAVQPTVGKAPTFCVFFSVFLHALFFVPGLRLVNEAMAPFFEWLEEADEESDED